MKGVSRGPLALWSRLAVLIVAALPTAGAAGVAELARRWSRLLPATPSEGPPASPVALRELADGTTVVVSKGYVVAHVGQTGLILSEAPIDLRSDQGLSLAFAITDGGSVVAAWADGQRGWAMRWDGRTGRKEWSAPASLTALSQYLAPALAIDGSGNVLIGFGGTSAARLIGLDGRDGHTLFSSTLAVPHRYVRTTALAVDPGGDAILAAGTRDIERRSPDEWLLARLAAGTGVVRWRSSLALSVPADFSSPHGPPTSIAIDAHGDVLACGTSTGTGVERMEVLKVSGTTGGRLWGPVSGRGTSSGRLLALDARGGAFVAGDGATDVIERIDAATGAWDQTFRATTDDLATAPRRLYVRGERLVVEGSRLYALGSLRGELLWIGPSAATSDWSGSTIRSASDVGVLREVDPSNGAIRGPDVFLASPTRPDGFPLVTALTPDGLLTALTVSDYGAPRTLRVVRLDPVTGLPVGDGVFLPADLPPSGLPISDASPLVTREGGFLFLSSASREVRKVGRGGQLIWTWREPLSLGSTSWIARMKVDANGDVLALMPSGDLWKIDGEAGTTLWGPTRVGLETKHSIALDPNGDVHVMSGKGWDYTAQSAIAKVSGLDGSVLWGAYTLEGTLGPQSLRVDGAGNALVLGFEARGPRYRVVKLQGSTGLPLWSFRTSLDEPYWAVQDLVSTATGDVILCGDGLLFGNPSREARAILRLDATTGAPLWGDQVSGWEPNRHISLHLSPNGDPITLHWWYEGLAVVRHDAGTGAVTSDVTVPAKGYTYPARPVFAGEDPIVAARLDGPVWISRFSTGLGVTTWGHDLPTGHLGLAYSARLRATNGKPPYRFGIAAGALPEGLRLEESDGTVSGMPAAIGLFPFRLSVSDSANDRVEMDFEIAIADFRVAGIPGDLNLDSAKDVFDVVALMGHVVGNLPAGTEPFLAPATVADVDGNGRVDVFDVVRLMNIVAGNAPGG